MIVTMIKLQWCCNEFPIEELHIRQKKGLVDEDAVLLVVDDPKPNIGSGSATLNALLCVAEYLAAKEGMTVREEPGRGTHHLITISLPPSLSPSLSPLPPLSSLSLFLSVYRL